MNDYINRQVEERARAWGEAKELLDHAAAEGRDLTAEEQQKYDRINADLDERTAVIEKITRDMEREAQAADIRVPQATAAPSTDEDLLRSLVRGEIRTATFEKRQMTTSGDSGTVPQGFYDVMQEQMRYTGPFGNEEVGYTILTTASGEDIKVPTQSGFSSATATAEAAAFDVSISRELLEDAGVPIVDFIGRQAGNAIGNIVNEKLAVGTGTVEPQGIVDASAAGKTGGTGVAGAFTADDLIDLVHAVDSQYAANRAGFQMRRSTLAELRSLKDNDGRFIYDPTQGTQALVLGYPVFENPHVAAVGTSNKSVVFGSMPYYHVRQVGGVEIARSDDAYFVNDLVAFRVSIRLDGNLSQANAVKHFVGGAS